MIIPSYAAAEVTNLYCDVGVANYTSPGQEGLWIDYTPTVNDNENMFTFASVPQTINQDGIDFEAYTFAFVCYPLDSSGVSAPVTFEKGYVYTFNFTIQTTRLLDPDLTSFSFGICQEGFTDARPLAEVVYTLENVTSNVKRYYVTSTVNVDDSFPLSSMGDPYETYYYLQMGSDWTADFRLIASNMTSKKSVGEDAYYQASLDAIENLPNAEYEFTLNMMPDAEGEIELIKGDIDDITQELHLVTNDLYDVIMGVQKAEPMIYFPTMRIPHLDIDVLESVDEQSYFKDGFFYPLVLITAMGGLPRWVSVALAFVRITFVIGFVTYTLDNMLRVEWWL